MATDLYVAHALWLLEQGCAGLVPFGTTGGSALGRYRRAHRRGAGARRRRYRSCEDDPRDRRIEYCRLGAPVARMSRHGLRGCHDVAAVYYKAVSEDGLYRHFVQLVEAIGADVRVYLYHIPPIAVVGIPPALAARLHTEFPENVVGIKDSSGDWDNTRSLLDIEGLLVYPGSELPLLDALELGAPGCISATANLNSAAIAAVIRAWIEVTSTPRASCTRR